jgi:hypothetical protein
MPLLSEVSFPIVFVVGSPVSLVVARRLVGFRRSKMRRGEAVSQIPHCCEVTSSPHHYLHEDNCIRSHEEAFLVLYYGRTSRRQKGMCAECGHCIRALDIAAAVHGLARRRSRSVLIGVNDNDIEICIDKKDAAVPFSWLVGIIIIRIIIIIGHNNDHRL